MPRILDVHVKNCSTAEAIELMQQLFDDYTGGAARYISIVNAHTLNLASEDESYREVLNASHVVLGDGTGVRWAARMRGEEMKANLVGTDLLPNLFGATAGKGYRYFLLGATAETVVAASRYCEATFPGWTLAGFHHGYLDDTLTKSAIEEINAAQPHLLLVAMGNPKQERWMHRYRGELKIPACVGVGGLFDHWAGNLTRAPLWVRRLGFEWLQILLQQPKLKWRRYLIGNVKFLLRITLARGPDMSPTTNGSLHR